MKKFMYAALLLLTLSIVFGAVFGFIEFRDRMIGTILEAYIPPPVGVEANPASNDAWDQTLAAIGTVKAVNGVDITTEASGLIKEIYFASGQNVTEGEVLIQLDDVVEQANLKSYRAQARLAQINYDRDSRLLKTKSISRTAFDKVEATLNDARAQVERTEALIAQKQVKAPFSGRLGIRLVDVGEYVKGGDDIVTLQAMDELLLNFSVPEQHLPRLYVGQKIRFTVPAHGAKVFEAILTSLDAKVEESTRNIRVQGSFQNTDLLLLPGMFANIDVVLDEKTAVITVPQTAVSYSLYGDSVFVVNEEALNLKQPKNTVEFLGMSIELPSDYQAEQPPEQGLVVRRRYVKLGQRQGDRVAVVEGVKAGELVVTAGQLKLNNGARVVLVEEANTER